MAIGYGYGSEWHLLRYTGRHRQRFDREVLKAVGRPQDRMEWEDFLLAPGKRWPDVEWKGLDFLASNQALQTDWAAFWPQGRGIHSWDAVGWIGDERELLLVEAKAHLDELKSDCKAKSKASRATIAAALAWTKSYLGVTASADWMKTYYQHTNRLAALAFLHDHGVAARLLFVYFVGDRSGRGRRCPQSQQGWARALAAQAKHVRPPKQHPLSKRVHSLFLPVA